MPIAEPIRCVRLEQAGVQYCVDSFPSRQVPNIGKCKLAFRLFDYTGATALAAVMLLVSFAIMLMINVFQSRLVTGH